MRRAIAVVGLVAVMGLIGMGPASAAGNPSITGPPSQSCQAQPSEPGHASSSIGSPFNEPSGSNPGGIGGQHYNEMSQYDVACYQVSVSH